MAFPPLFCYLAHYISVDDLGTWKIDLNFVYFSGVLVNIAMCPVVCLHFCVWKTVSVQIYDILELYLAYDFFSLCLGLV
jgi:hypothetical protein